MSTWLSALLAQQAPAILVTVAHAEGSVPREAGARMLVAADRLHDTIGGGHLEYVAERMARDMLAQPPEDAASQRRLERLPLGPTLGQCCGGVAFLAFERVEPAGHAHFREIAEALARNTAVQRRLPLDSAAPPLLEPASAASTRLINDEQGARWLLDPCEVPAELH